MLPFYLHHIKDEAIQEVIDTLKSNWITTGPKTKLFEKKLTEYYNGKKTLCVSSATFGLEIILRWFGVQEGDEVIIPAYTYTATGNAVLHTGAKPVIVDVNQDDFNISLKAIEEAITENTKVIIPVDVAGLPVDYDGIMQIVNKEEIKRKFRPKNAIQKKLNRILILSDAAHSFGAKYKNKKTGSLADITVFSFHAVKNITTGEGGAIAFNLPYPFNQDEIYQLLNIYSLHGQSKDALAKTLKGSWQYDVIYPGFKGNMTDIQASLGLVALKYYDSENIPRRKTIMQKYHQAFKNYSWAELPILIDEHRETSYHIYLLRIKNINEDQRNKIIDSIFQKGIAVNVHFQPLSMLSAYKSKGYNISEHPIAYDNYSREITLPVYEDLKDSQIEMVIDAVVSSVNEIL